MQTANLVTNGKVLEGVVDVDVAVHAPDERLVRIGPPLDVVMRRGAYEVPNYGWVTRDFWGDVQQFQQALPPLPPNFPVDLVTDKLGDTKRWNQTAWAEDIENKMRLNPARGVVWHVVARDGHDLVGFEAVLGKEQLVEWTWADAHVMYPMLRGFAVAYNIARKIFGTKATNAA